MANEKPSIWRNIKENPIKSITGILTILTFIVGFLVWVDDRYVHASFVDEYRQEQTQMKTEWANTNDLNRIKDYEDRIEMIEIKEQLGKATEIDRLTKPRLERKIQDLKENIRRRGGSIN